MKFYHLYFYLLKIIILLLLLLVALKIIKINNNIFILIDFIFKFSLGLFIILFFSNNRLVNLEKEDRLIIIISGFILLLLIDYIEVIKIIKKEINNLVCYNKS